MPFLHQSSIFRHLCRVETCLNRLKLGQKILYMHLSASNIVFLILAGVFPLTIALNYVARPSLTIYWEHACFAIVLNLLYIEQKFHIIITDNKVHICIAFHMLWI